MPSVLWVNRGIRPSSYPPPSHRIEHNLGHQVQVPFAANSIELDTAGGLLNSGAIAGRQIVALTDLENHAEYKASGTRINLGAGTSFDGQYVPTGSGAGIGSDSGSASSLTKAGISGMAGNTDTRTGDPQTGIDRIFDAEKVQKEIDAQAKITQTFGQQVGKVVEDYATEKRKELQNQLKNAETEAEVQGHQRRRPGRQ